MARKNTKKKENYFRAFSRFFAGNNDLLLTLQTNFRVKSCSEFQAEIFYPHQDGQSDTVRLNSGVTC